METLVNYVNKHHSDLNLNIKFSTPSEYLAALESEKQEFPVFTGDLISLANTNDVWTGYYSSRAGLKKSIKTASAESHI